MKTKKIPLTIFLSSCLLVAQAQVTVNVDLTKPRVPMSKELIGAFFEDINYGADGGLYAELIQNRSFEYYPVQGYTTSGPLEAWSAIQQGGASVMLTVENSTPLNQNNPHYLNLVINQPGSVAGVKNAGFDGIALTKGDNYNFSVYLKRTTDYNEQVVVQLNRADGSVISSGTITSTSGEWKKYTLTLQSDATTADACLSILPKGKGSICLDMVSLFPQKTFRNRANGLRNDLAQTIADMKPKFLRFPGGCITHGRGLANAYRWKATVGDVAERTPNWNTWGYHQTYGLGFYEFF
ncbi:MAG: carbohydrate binding domain-containing protein, partial [Bacteroidota bacterium]|nr:carbohydrate binding domain-containing protein [Bacteroidota bacterium]